MFLYQTPNNTDAIYIAFFLTLFPLWSLSQQNSFKGISCWSPLLPGPGAAYCMCGCVLYVTTSFHRCHVQVISPWTDNEAAGRQSDGENYIPPEDLCSVPSYPHNPSLTEHFLLVFLPLQRSLSPITVHTFNMYCQSHTHTLLVSLKHTHTQMHTHGESGWGHCLESEYYSRHPKGRNPVTPLLFSKHKRLPLREEADSYGMCYQGSP